MDDKFQVDLREYLTITLNKLATCALRFQQGIYGKDIIEVDYRDRLGHDTTHCECKDYESCLDRRGY